MPQMTEPFTRFQPVISRTQANMFSNTASSVESAANIINRKNSVPQRRPPAGHVVEHGSHGVKEQTGARVYLYAEGKAGGEDYEARRDRHKGIQYDDIDGFAQQRMVFVEIAAEYGHGAYV